MFVVVAFIVITFTAIAAAALFAFPDLESLSSVVSSVEVLRTRELLLGDRLVNDDLLVDGGFPVRRGLHWLGGRDLQRRLHDHDWQIDSLTITPAVPSVVLDASHELVLDCDQSAIE